MNNRIKMNQLRFDDFFFVSQSNAESIYCFIMILIAMP